MGVTCTLTVSGPMDNLDQFPAGVVEDGHGDAALHIVHGKRRIGDPSDEVALERPEADEALRRLGTTLLAFNERHERLMEGLLTLASSENRFQAMACDIKVTQYRAISRGVR